MTSYNNDLKVGLDSNNDAAIQLLSHQVGELQLIQFDLEDEGQDTSQIEEQIEALTQEIESLRQQGR